MKKKIKRTIPIFDLKPPVMEVSDDRGYVRLEKCTGAKQPNSKGKCVKPTPDDWVSLYKRYPELKPNSEGRLCKRTEENGVSCKERALRDDVYCLFHTRRNLLKYDINFLCNRKKKNGRRCTRHRLEDDVICHLHKVRDADKEGIKARSAKGILVVKERTENHNHAVKSSKPEDWYGMMKWVYKDPKDVIKLYEEVANRLRWGSLPVNMADMLLSVGKTMLDAESKILDIKMTNAETIEIEAAREKRKQILVAKDRTSSVRDQIKKASLELIEA